jgi:hypothetical protein
MWNMVTPRNNLKSDVVSKAPSSNQTIQCLHLALSDIKEVRWFICLSWLLCVCRLEDSFCLAWAIFGFFWVGHWPSALHDFSDEEHPVWPSLGYPRAEAETANHKYFMRSLSTWLPRSLCVDFFVI